MPVIKPKKITIVNIHPFGSLVTVPNFPAPKQGHNWDCWNRLADLGLGNFSVGVVKTRSNSKPIVSMERHHKKEIIIPVMHPVIQTLALPGDVNNEDAEPVADEVEAFIIYPGEAVVLDPGVWHWAAIPLENYETIYFYLTEPNYSDHRYGGWINFKNDDSVVIQKGDN